MYLRIPRFRPEAIPAIISFFGHTYKPKEYVLDGAKAVIVYCDMLDLEHNKIEHILSDPQLQSHDVVVTNHILQSEYGFRYVESYEEIPAGSLYITYGWGCMSPFTQEHLCSLTKRGVNALVIDVTVDQVTQTWNLNDDIVRLWVDEELRYAFGDNESVSLLDPARPWKKTHTPPII